jgi:hypothetical protein
LPFTSVVTLSALSVMLGADTVPSDTAFSVAEVRKALKLVGTLLPPRTRDLFELAVDGDDGEGPHRLMLEGDDEEIRFARRDLHHSRAGADVAVEILGDVVATATGLRAAYQRVGPG